MKQKSVRILTAVWLAVVMCAAPAFAQAKDAPDEMTGIKVGEKAPEFTLKDQSGEEQSLATLLEKEGITVLVFYRSADW